VIEQNINKFFSDDESTGFGTGWWSGILSAFFGFLSFGGVLCLHFPQLLTSPELRPHYPMHVMRLLIQCLIVGAILFGIISSILRKKKILALTGMLLAVAATALGGSSVRINDTLQNGPAIGLDWFLLDMFLMALIYVRKTLAPVSKTGNIQERMDSGCGLLHVHSSAYTDFVFSGFIACYPGHQIFRGPGSSGIYRSNALVAAIFPGRCGCGHG
jgi:hypothetical protein